MADVARAEELVQAMERDGAFRTEVEAAPTVAAKRQVLDARGFVDVGFDDMRAWVASKGSTLVVQPGGRELTDAELAAVAGGLTNDEFVAITLGVGMVGAMAAVAAVT